MRVVCIGLSPIKFESSSAWSLDGRGRWKTILRLRDNSIINFKVTNMQHFVGEYFYQFRTYVVLRWTLDELSAETSYLISLSWNRRTVDELGCVYREELSNVLWPSTVISRHGLNTTDCNICLSLKGEVVTNLEWYWWLPCSKAEQ